MDRFVKNFIIVSIIYLGVSSILGVCMLWNQSLMSLKFVHSHLNMLGWVSMMIYGVGYHVLPRFSGRPLKYPKDGRTAVLDREPGANRNAVFLYHEYLHSGTGLQ